MDAVEEVRDTNINFTNFPSRFFSKNSVTPLSTTASPKTVMEEPFYSKFRSTGRSNVEYIDENATMRVVKPVRHNMNVSLAKCNVKPIYPYDADQKLAEELTCKFLEPFLTQDVAPDDHKYDINRSSSPGKFWKRKGCKTKADAIEHSEFMDYVTSIDHIPIFDYNGKVELLDEKLIDGGKIRGTFNPPADFIIKQKKLYDKQNTAMKENYKNSWIKHGFVKEYGGFNELAKELEEADIVSEDDVNGYDRSSWLEPVYRIRNRFLNYSENLFLLVAYVTYYTVRSFVRCPDGVIRQRSTGNASGSNNTTPDNCILHVLITFRLIINIYRLKLLRTPTFDECLKVAVSINIYSDDNTSGWRFPFELSLDEFKQAKIDTYLQFGFTLKPTQHLLTRVVNKRLDPRHSFLGASFHFDEEVNQYLPYPRVDKITSSLKYSVGKMPKEDLLVRTLALMALSVVIPVLYDEVSKFYKFLLEQIPKSKSLMGDELYYLGFEAMNNPRVLLHRYTGRQSGGQQFSTHFILVGWRHKMEKAVKAEGSMRQSLRALGVSDSGRRWIETVLDPFKDLPLKPRGYPDRVMNNSVVQTIHANQTISGAGLGHAGQWDCNIFLDPLYTKTNLLNTTVNAYNGFERNSQNTSSQRGGLRIRSATAGTVLDYQTDESALSMGLATDVFEDDTSARVIGIGFEVHNKTNELHKQGSLISYRVDDECKMTVGTAFEDVNTACIPMSMNVVKLVEPPATATEAIDLPGSVEWNAIDGAYVVPRMNKESNEPADLEVLGVLQTDFTTGDQAFNILETVGTAKVIKTEQQNLVIPYSTSGVFLTGLSPETELTINLTYYIEQFPSFGSPMHRIAEPSCSEDLNAIRLYTILVKQLPSAVKVNDNFTAAFVSGLASMMRTVAKAAPTVMKVASGISSAYSFGNELIKTYNEDQRGQSLADLPRNNQKKQKRVNNQQMVVYQPPNPRRAHEEVVVREKGNGRHDIIVRDEAPVRRIVNAPRHNGTRVARNRRNKDFDRLNHYMISAGAGPIEHK